MPSGLEDGCKASPVCSKTLSASETCMAMEELEVPAVRHGPDELSTTASS